MYICISNGSFGAWRPENLCCSSIQNGHFEKCTGSVGSSQWANNGHGLLIILYHLLCRIVSAVEIIGAAHPPLHLHNKTWADETRASTSFSQTIVDLTVVPGSDNVGTVAFYIDTEKPHLNDSRHEVKVESGVEISLAGVSTPLAAVDGQLLSTLSCTNSKQESGSRNCRHRLQFNVYATDVLFQDKRGQLFQSDSVVVGVKIGDMERVTSNRTIVTLQMAPFNMVSCLMLLKLSLHAWWSSGMEEGVVNVADYQSTGVCCGEGCGNIWCSLTFFHFSWISFTLSS